MYRCKHMYNVRRGSYVAEGAGSLATSLAYRQTMAAFIFLTDMARFVDGQTLVGG